MATLNNAYTNIRNAFRFVYSFTHPEQPLGHNEPEIISQIHSIRFIPHNTFLITGGHFADLFVRNMGTFYNAILDPRIPSTQEDWHNRQSICYRTIKLALEVFTREATDSTTISHLWGNEYTTSNIYARASDSLYAILYGLKMLTDINTIPTCYPIILSSRAQRGDRGESSDTSNQPTVFHNPHLNMLAQAQNLITQYKFSLSHLITQYLTEILDPHTHLVRSDLHLSSARDGIKRQSSFYDNVIAWATVNLALQLKIPLEDIHLHLETQKQWQQQIINTYWNPQTGIFHDDIETTSFSADQLVVLTIQFLNYQKKEDAAKLHSIIAYIQQHHLDQPFPLHYSDQHVPQKLHWPVRYFAPHYMTHSIWSHWGIEYIKLLILLSPDNPKYRGQAKKHLDSYKRNIETYGGYPECYDLHGKPLKEGLYRTVLHTSWVVNYEQAKMLYNYYK